MYASSNHLSHISERSHKPRERQYKQETLYQECIISRIPKKRQRQSEKKLNNMKSSGFMNCFAPWRRSKMNFECDWGKLNLISLPYCLSRSSCFSPVEMHQNHNLWSLKNKRRNGRERDQVQHDIRLFARQSKGPHVPDSLGVRWMLYDYRLKWQMSAHSELRYVEHAKRRR